MSANNTNAEDGVSAPEPSSKNTNAEDISPALIFSSPANPAVPSSVDTSWYKRSCKEPPPTIPQDEDRGLHHHDRSADNVLAVFIKGDQLWTGTPQILHYWFLNGEGSDVQKKKVREAIEEWTWYANVEFDEARSVEESEVRIKFDPNDGSWSSNGRECLKKASTEATMNLAWLDKFSTSMTMNERAVILHEFGHVLGLLHEHQSPAHGGVAIKDVQAALRLYSVTQGWSDKEIYDKVINVYSQSDVSNFSQVDTTSIMHYPQPKELTGLPNDIPFNTKLSDLDKAYIILQYPRKELHSKAKAEGWTFVKALDVMGVPDELKSRVSTLLESDRDGTTGEINPTRVREVIQEWTRVAHAASGA